jgi:hypothetical protein
MGKHLDCCRGDQVAQRKGHLRGLFAAFFLRTRMSFFFEHECRAANRGILKLAAPRLRDDECEQHSKKSFQCGWFSINNSRTITAGNNPTWRACLAGC